MYMYIHIHIQLFKGLIILACIEIYILHNVNWKYSNNF